MTERANQPLILVLGAGASLGARARCATLPPLGCGLGKYLLDWLDANEPRDELTSDFPLTAGERLWHESLLPKLREELNGVIGQESPSVDETLTPFEVLMDKWTKREDGHRILIAMQTLLAYAFLVGHRCAFHEHLDLLDRLVRGLPRERPLIVITLNYDLLLEEAFLRDDQRFTYPAVPGVEKTIFFSEGHGEPTPVYKIHGSINWLSVRSPGSADPEVARRATEPVKVEERNGLLVTQTYATYVPPNRESLFLELERSTGTPVAAVYGTGKPVVENAEHVDAHRRDCLARIARLVEGDALVIGVRHVGEDDDPVLDEVLRAIAKLDGEKTYVNPSDDDCRHFERLGYGTVAKTLEDWLDVWPHRQAPDTQ
jgi:hypothetical protein